MSKHIQSFSLEQDTYKKFKKHCTINNVSMSNIVNSLINNYLEEEEVTHVQTKDNHINS